MIRPLIKISLIIVICFVNSIEAQYLGRENYKELTNSDFKQRIKLISKPLGIENGKLINPSGIIFLDPYLLISDVDTPKYIHVINAKDKKYLGQFIDIGDGIDELSSPAVFLENGKHSFIVSDHNKKEFLIFDVNKLLNSMGSSKNGEIEKERLTYFLNYNKENNKLFYAGNFTDKYLLYEKDLDSGTIEGFGEKLHAPSGKLNSIEVRNSLSVGRIMYKNSHFAFAYNFAPLIEVFDYEKNELLSVVIPHKELPKYFAEVGEDTINVGYTNDTIYEFGYVTLSDNYVYVSYIGKKYGLRESKNSTIYVLDYKLNPIRMFDLDAEVTFIAVNNDDTIYAIKNKTFSSTTREVLVYDIKQYN